MSPEEPYKQAPRRDYFWRAGAAKCRAAPARRHWMHKPAGHPVNYLFVLLDFLVVKVPQNVLFNLENKITGAMVHSSVFQIWLPPLLCSAFVFVEMSVGAPGELCYFQHPHKKLDQSIRNISTSQKEIGSKYSKYFLKFWEQSYCCCEQTVIWGRKGVFWFLTSASFLAELSVSSPRKLFIFITWKNIFWMKVSKKYFI